MRNNLRPYIYVKRGVEWQRCEDSVNVKIKGEWVKWPKIIGKLKENNICTKGMDIEEIILLYKRETGNEK